MAQAEAIRIGILNDMDHPVGPPPGEQPHGDPSPWLQRCVDAARAAGRIDRPVEFVIDGGPGLPGGTAAAVEHAYARLVAADVLMIVGPAIGDNALVATPLAERYRVPTINWAGSERARGEWMFHLQYGSHEDESLVIARHLHALGCRRIAVAFDRSPIGMRYLRFLEDEANRQGLRITGTAGLAPLSETAGPLVADLLEGKPDAFVYLGLGLAAPAVAGALAATGWQGPRAMNTAGIRGYDPGFAAKIEGWLYVDMVADGNTVLAGLAPADDQVQRMLAARCFDLGQLVTEGIARAPELTREGMKLGLELVKWLPAAEGFEGTLLGFGVHDRGALHGRYLVMRQWLGGRTVQAA